MDTHKSPSPSPKTVLKVMAAVTKPRLPKGSGLIAYALACTIAGLALTLDPQLINPWGISSSATSPFWISNAGTGTSTLYNTAGAKQALVVTIPGPGGPVPAVPTGQVRAFEQLGYRSYAEGFVDRDNQYLVPMVLLTEDYIHLATVNSPFARLIAREDNPVTTGEWFAKTYPAPARAAAKGANEDQVWEHLTQVLRQSPLEGIPLLHDLTYADARRFIGVGPAWASWPVKVISYQRWPWQSVTTPMVLPSISRIGPCSMWASK